MNKYYLLVSLAGNTGTLTDWLTLNGVENSISFDDILFSPLDVWPYVMILMRTSIYFGCPGHMSLSTFGLLTIPSDLFSCYFNIFELYCSFRNKSDSGFSG